METRLSRASRLVKMELWGWTITTYSPILDSSGEAVGFLACDFDADPLVSVLRRKILKMAAVGLAFLCAGVVFVFGILRGFFRVLAGISGTMARLSSGEGDLTAALPVERLDEIGNLAQSCNRVIHRVRDMVDSIKGSVADLSRPGGA
jgi:methyl-accepting chemotaxis protein